MVLPIIIAGAVLGSLIIAGCSGSKEERAPGGAPFLMPDSEQAEPRRDAFIKSPEEMPIDDRSFAAFNYLWSDADGRSHISMWEPRSRLYIGAASDLLKPIYENDEDLGPKVKAYRDSVTNFFQQNYLKSDDARGLPLEESIMVLIGGLAPASVDQQVFFGALDALAGASGASEGFANVLKAGHYYNVAANLAGANVSAEELTKARSLAGLALNLLNGVDESELDDRQIEFLLTLKGRANSLNDSLSTPPPVADTKIITKKKKIKADPESETGPKFTIPNPGKY